MSLESVLSLLRTGGGWVQISGRTTSTAIEDVRDVTRSAHISAKRAGTYSESATAPGPRIWQFNL